MYAQPHIEVDLMTTLRFSAEHQNIIWLSIHFCGHWIFYNLLSWRKPTSFSGSTAAQCRSALDQHRAGVCPRAGKQHVVRWVTFSEDNSWIIQQEAPAGDWQGRSRGGRHSQSRRDTAAFWQCHIKQSLFSPGYTVCADQAYTIPANTQYVGPAS